MRSLTGVLIFTGLFIATSCSITRTSKSNELKVENRISDQANLLTEDEEKMVFQMIKELDQKIGSQIAILTIDTLYGELIDDLSFRIAQQSGLGRREFNDGVLITIAVKDRKMRIEVGLGLENVIKDEMAAKIIREDMAPRFREKDYYGGITNAVKKIKEVIEDNKELIGK